MIASKQSEKEKEKSKILEKDNEKKIKIIREMGLSEQWFHQEVTLNGIINATSFMLTTSIDLFANKDVVNQSVNYWKLTQPFLCSRVISPEKSSLYFAYTSEEKISKADNITYLYFKNDSNNKQIDDCKDYWKLLIEREYTIPINWKDGPMWRLMFIKLKNNDLPDKFEYCLITTATHSIFDGHSAFQTFAHLLSIIENVYADKIKKEHIKQAKVSSTIEEIVTNHLEKLENIGQFNKLDGFKQPDNFLVKNIHSDRKEYIPVDEINNGNNTDLKGAFYSDVDHKECISLENLVEISKKSLTKMYFTSFTGDKFKKFINVCKANNTKVTGVINMMFVLGWRMAYEIQNDETKMNELKSKISSTSSDRHPIMSTTKLCSARTQPINFSTIVNLRSHIKDLQSDALAWLCNSLYSSFDQDTDPEDPEFWKTTFWNYARQESEQFHARLKQGEQFQIFEAQKPLEKGESRTHFGLSNLVIPFEALRNLKLFKINALYTTGSYREGAEDDFSFNNMININDSLFWIVCYNSLWIKNEAIKIFIDSVKDIFDVICDIK